MSKSPHYQCISCVIKGLTVVVKSEWGLRGVRRLGKSETALGPSCRATRSKERESQEKKARNVDGVDFHAVCSRTTERRRRLLSLSIAAP